MRIGKKFAIGSVRRHVVGCQSLGGDAEAGGGEAGVGVGPGFFEAGLDCGGFGGVLLLEATGEAEEGPAVFGQALQVGTVDGFRLREAAGGDEDGSEGMAGGLGPGARLDSARAVLLPDCLG